MDQAESAPSRNKLALTRGKLIRAVLDLPTAWRRTFLVTWDSLSWVIALLAFVLIRYDLSLTNVQWFWTLLYIGLAIAIQVIGGFALQIYLGRSRIGSFAEATWIGALTMLIALTLGPIFSAVTQNFPHGVGLVVPPFALIWMAGGRWLFRVATSTRHQASSDAVPVLIYGAGSTGHQVALLVDKDDAPHYEIRGLIDDDVTKRFLRINGHRMLGTGDDLVEVARATDVRKVILAISKAPAHLIQHIHDECHANGLELVIVPPVSEMIGGRVSLAALREFNVQDLLGRRPIHTDLSSIAGYVTGKTVLVTGAGGSIGSELANQVHKLGPSKLILLDRDESALHAVQLRLYGVGLLDTDDMVLCSIRDHEALKAVFEHHRPDVVFHAAALKHLPMLEQYPAEGWKTNVWGTANVLCCARQAGVTNFVNISTDKAADASSVLGRSKRIAERLTAWYAKRYDLAYLSVRFGNVLGSRGSVLHTFRAQIDRGGPVTVTHPDVTRYFMTIPEACELVLQAGAIGNPGDVMVLDMGEPVRIVDVAERLIAESGKSIEVHFTGLREGEKLDEVLFSEGEAGDKSAHPLINSVQVDPLDPATLPREKPRREDVYGLLGQDEARQLTAVADTDLEALVS
uniref:polysaccharide biosynthesis protein n=1 Tax=Tessaracoccus bendigoensis TaxID=72764 RepID=UPI001C316DB3|nr:nucleoside-diphosphate sugar epimerase/dehydratase [Tessaracoccus bendigoensis]